MGFFDKLKGKTKGFAGEALHAAVETAQDKVSDAVADKLTDATQQAAGGALARLGATPPGGAVAGAARAATDLAVETGVTMAADAGTAAVAAKLNGEPRAE